MLEKRIFERLTDEELASIPRALPGHARSLFRQLLDAAIREVAGDRVVDGPTAMQPLRERIRGTNLSAERQ